MLYMVSFISEDGKVGFLLLVISDTKDIQWRRTSFKAIYLVSSTQCDKNIDVLELSCIFMPFNIITHGRFETQRYNIHLNVL